jgi:hypothetical protein
MIEENKSKCSVCKNEFVKKKSNQVCCSKQCNNKIQKQKQKSIIEPRECKTCNKLFTPKKGKNTKYCCALCGHKKWLSVNKDEFSEYRKEVYKKKKEKNPELLRDEARFRMTKRVYGLTKEQYYIMLSNQNNRCKICNKILDPASKFTHIDHCHQTSKVRGILCGSCNNGLGMFKDNIQNLYSAINYLQQNA